MIEEVQRVNLINSCQDTRALAEIWLTDSQNRYKHGGMQRTLLNETNRPERLITGRHARRSLSQMH